MPRRCSASTTIRTRSRHYNHAYTVSTPQSAMRTAMVSQKAIFLRKIGAHRVTLPFSTTKPALMPL